MRTPHISLLLLLSLFALPLFVSAAENMAGTDRYLRSIGWSEERLSEPAATEDREAFEIARGPQKIEDPLGDVLNRAGRTSMLSVPWADIRSVEMKRNEGTKTWDFVVSLGAAVPFQPEAKKAQMLIYVDRDDNAENNSAEGIKIGTDAEFAVQYNADRGWYADFRWYNPAADFWAVDKKTAMTFEMGTDKFLIKIPFDEVASASPSWRVTMAAADGEDTQVDAAPTVGFPAKKQTETAAPTGEKRTPAGAIAFLGAAVLALGLGAWRMRK